MGMSLKPQDPRITLIEQAIASDDCVGLSVALAAAGAFGRAQKEKASLGVPIHLLAQKPQLLARLILEQGDSGAREWVRSNAIVGFLRAGDEATVKAAQLAFEPKDWEPLLPEMLRAATCFDKPRIVRHLLALSPEAAKAPSFGGNTALMLAAENGLLGCLRELLPFSDPLARNKEGSTPLHEACWNAHAQCVRELLPVSDPLALDGSGRAPLSRVLLGMSLNEELINRRVECVRMMAPVSDLNARDEEGLTPLGIALGGELWDAAKILLAGTDLKARSEDGTTYLMRAAAANGRELVALLLPHSDALARDKEGRAAADFARRPGREALRGLIMSHADAQLLRAAIPEPSLTPARAPKAL